MNHIPNVQTPVIVGTGHDRLAGATPHSRSELRKLHSIRLQFHPTRGGNGAVDSSPAETGFVGGVDDGRSGGVGRVAVVGYGSACDGEAEGFRGEAVGGCYLWEGGVHCRLGADLGGGGLDRVEPVEDVWGLFHSRINYRGLRWESHSREVFVVVRFFSWRTF